MHYHDSADAEYDKQLREAAPESYKALMRFRQTVFDEDTSSLDRRTKELIAIALATTTQCPYCIEHHVHAALDAGADRAQVAAAVMLSCGMRAGASYSHGWMAMKYVDAAQPA